MFMLKAKKGFTSFIKNLERRKYHTHRQWWVILFGWKGTVFPRIFSRLLVLILLSAGLNVLRHYEKWFPIIKPTAHTLVGMGLGLLLVYRTNASYDRYWEGRKLWGSLVNTTRNIVRFCRTYEKNVPLDNLANLLTAYVIALKQRLRYDDTLESFKTFLPPEVPLWDYIEHCPNKPLAISAVTTDWIERNLKSIVDSPEKMRIIENYMGVLIDVQGGLERIWNTPIPFSYVSLVHHLLTYYLLTLPMVLIQDFEWFAIPATALIGIGLLGVEQAGLEIEDPFDTDKNSLQLDSICNTIQANLEYLAKRPHLKYRKYSPMAYTDHIHIERPMTPPTTNYSSVQTPSEPEVERGRMVMDEDESEVVTDESADSRLVISTEAIQSQ